MLKDKSRFEPSPQPFLAMLVANCGQDDTIGLEFNGDDAPDSVIGKRIRYWASRELIPM